MENLLNSRVKEILFNKSFIKKPFKIIMSDEKTLCMNSDSSYGRHNFDCIKLTLHPHWGPITMPLEGT